MGKKEKIIIASIVVAFMALVLGVTYSWFNTSVTGSGTTMTVTTAELSIEYRDGNEIARSDWFPGDSVTKTFEVENTGTDTVFYDLQMVVSENTFENSELVYTLTSPTGANIAETPVPLSTDTIVSTVAIPYQATHTYTFTITFKEMSTNQNQNQRKNFTGTIEIDSSYRYTAGGQTVEGQVVDIEGNGVEGALVTFFSTPKSTTTGSNGYYKIQGLNPGGHTVEVTYEGLTKTTNVNLVAGGSGIVNNNTINTKEDKAYVNIVLDEEINIVKSPEVTIIVTGGTSDKSKISYVGVNNPVIITANIGHILSGAAVTCDNGITHNYNTNTLIITSAINDGVCRIELSEQDLTLSMTLDGDPISTLPTTENYVLHTYTCTNGETASFDSTTKTISLTPLSVAPATCLLNFRTANNRVTINVINGISTPGEVYAVSGGSATATINSIVGYNIFAAIVSCPSGITGTMNNGILTVSNVTTSGICTITVPHKYLSAVATQGDYIDYTGNNGCTGNACIGCNASGGNSYSDPGTPGSQCNTTGGYCYGSYYKYNAYGWRVAYIDRNSTPHDYSDDSVYITTGGSPECLSVNPSTIENLNTSSLKYCNENYVYGGVCNSSSAWNMNDTDFQKILGSTSVGCYNTSTLEGCISNSSVACGSTNPIIINNGFYWFGKTYGSKNVYHISINNISAATDIMQGIRPVIRLATGITYDGTGNGEQATPYILNSVY